jgi:hypothetical protein
MTREEFCALAMKQNIAITNCDTEIVESAAEVEHCRKEVATLETGIAALVAAETEGGKPRFSNETARKAELAARLGDNEQYLSLRQRLADREQEYQSFKIERDSAYRLFQIALAFGGNQ